MAAVAVFLLLSSCSSETESEESVSAEQNFDRVLFFAIDGLSVAGLDSAETPVIDSLIAAGASTRQCHSALPTLSEPNWASILMGAGPSQHAATWNGWSRENPRFPPQCIGSTGYFPSIYTLMLDQKPGIKRVVVHCSEPWVEKTIAPDKPTKIIATKRRFDVADNAVKALDESVPDFMMIYQVFVDKVGHDFGWESERYVRSIDTLDTYIGHVLNGYRNKGLLDRTLVILISDHGGIGLDHGKANPEEVLVPLVFAGPGVKKGGTIDGPVNGFDFAPTMAAIFQLETPDCWIGKPLRNAFEGAKIPIISVDKK